MVHGLPGDTASEDMSEEFGYDEFRFELAMKISPKAGILHERNVAAFLKNLAQSHNGMVPRPPHGFCETTFKLENDNEPDSWRFIEYDDEPHRSQPPGESPVSS